MKAMELLNDCQEVFNTLNRIETLGYRSLTKLASLHGLCLRLSPDPNDAWDVTANYFLSGEWVKTNGIFVTSFLHLSVLLHRMTCPC